MKQLECNTQLKKLVIFGDWKRKLKVDKDLGMFKCLWGDRSTTYFQVVANQRNRKSWSSRWSGQVEVHQGMINIKVNFYKNFFAFYGRGSARLDILRSYLKAKYSFIVSREQHGLQKKHSIYNIRFLATFMKTAFSKPWDSRYYGIFRALKTPLQPKIFMSWLAFA